MKYIFTSILILSVFLKVGAQDCSDIFFSEYIEGSGNSKALELYNPTDGIIDLSLYTVVRYSNGGTNPSSGYFTKLQGFMQPKTTFVLVNGQTEDVDLGGSVSPKCDPELQSLADQLDGAYPAPTYMNGNDAIALLRKVDGNDVAVDLFGTIGGNMTSSDEGWTDFTDEWAYKNIYDVDGNITSTDSTYITDYIVPDGYYWLTWSANHTLIRKPSVMKGITADPGVFVVTQEWDTLAGGVDTWDELGRHDCDCSTLSVESKISTSKLSIYPNPANLGYFTLDAAMDIKELYIYNSVGAQIKSQSFDSVIRQKNISISDLKSGMYIIKVHFSDGSTEEKKIQKIN